MLALIRCLMVIALAAVAVAPPHMHAAAADLHHGVQAGHAHAEDDHGPSDHGQHGRHDASACCPSLSAQCGAVAVMTAGDWTAAELTQVGISRGGEQRDRADGLPPDFEPPPPRA
jgi:hypothetical protein